MRTSIAIPHHCLHKPEIVRGLIAFGDDAPAELLRQVEIGVILLRTTIVMRERPNGDKLRTFIPGATIPGSFADFLENPDSVCYYPGAFDVPTRFAVRVAYDEFAESHIEMCVFEGMLDCKVAVIPDEFVHVFTI